MICTTVIMGKAPGGNVAPQETGAGTGAAVPQAEVRSHVGSVLLPYVLTFELLEIQEVERKIHFGMSPWAKEDTVCAGDGNQCMNWTSVKGRGDDEFFWPCLLQPQRLLM